MMAVLVAGGGFALYKADPFGLFRAGPQAAEALPADAVFYFGVDLDPSAEQKVDALRFLNHFPAFRNAAGLQDAGADIRKAVFEQAVATSGCDLSYADDIEPWLGYKFGGAAVPVSGQGEPEVVVAIEVTDEGGAETGLAAVNECAKQDSGVGFAFAFVGDYAVAAETQELADKYAAAAEDESLADSQEFADDIEALGDLGVATTWVDVKGTMDAFGSGMGMLGAAQLQFLETAYQRVAATFRFESDSAEIITSIYGDLPAIDHGENQIVNLPDTTAVAFSQAGGDERIGQAWDALLDAQRNMGTDVDAQIAQFENQTGL
ncbi:MAG: DUF3352 domain-containing protein, partial [Nocardioidaceae bacterium]|nr:DUF3352 domain-containing protein [Nocardioidaceae bacterium]